MATPSEVVVLKSAHTTAVHVISSIEITNALEYSPPIAANLCIDTIKNPQVTYYKDSDSFQNIFGIDGYLRSIQHFQNNSGCNNNHSTTTDNTSSSSAGEYCSRFSICLRCEEENNMNNNIKTCNHICRGQEVSQKVNDVQYNHKVGNFSSENDESDDIASDIHSRNLSSPEKYSEALHFESPKTGCRMYDHNESRNQETSHEKLRPFSLSVGDQMSHKQNPFGVGRIPLLGFSSGTKMNSNVFLDSKSVKTSEYSNTYSPPQLPTQNDDLKHNDLKEHRENSSLIISRNRAGLQEEYDARDSQEKMADSEDVFKRDDTNVKENCFHPVDVAIQKMTLPKAKEITSFDSCASINPGSSHACAARAPTYGILNPLFDDSLRNIFLDRNTHSDQRKSHIISEKSSSSSFEPMNLWLPPLTNAPNTQGLFYYLPYCLPSISNASVNSKQNSFDSIVSMSSEKAERSPVPSLPKSVYKKHDRQSNSREEVFSETMNKGLREPNIAKKRSSFLSTASGEITLPYTPPDIQEELMFPNTSYGRGTEIIQNLNAREKDFILGRPTRTPRANNSFDLLKRDVENFPNPKGNEHRTKKIEKISLTGHKSPVRETCMTGATKIQPTIMTLGRDVENPNGALKPRKLEVYDSSDIHSICQENKHRQLDKTLSLPIDIPYKLDNFDREDYVSYMSETQAPEMNIPHCLRLNCLDPCKEGLCLNSMGKSNSLTNFNELSEQAIDMESYTVDLNLSQRRSSDSFIHNRSNLEKCNSGGRLKGPVISLDKKGGKQEKFAYQTGGNRKSLFTQHQSILHEDVEQEAVNRDQQQEIGKDSTSKKYSDSINSNNEQYKTHEQPAPFDNEQSRIGQFECHGMIDGVPPRKLDLSKYTPRLGKGSVVTEHSRAKQDIKVKDYQQSSFSSDDGAAHSSGSASQESLDNSNDSRKSLSLLDRRRNAAKRKDKLKLKIADRSSSEETKEGFELRAHFLRNVEDNVQVENTENCKIQSDFQTSQKEDHSLTSLVDDLTNYWLDSPSPNSLAPYPFLESPGDFACRTDIHSITKYPEASGFSRKSDLTCSNKTPTNPETKYRKRCRAGATKSATTVFENPVSMANCSPDSDKTLTREIVRNIIEEKRSRSKSNSASSPSDIQMDPTQSTRESQRHRKRETQRSPDANTSVPYEPLVTPSPMTPCGGFLGGSTPLLPGGSGKSFSPTVDVTNHGMEEDSAVFHGADFGRGSDEKITLQMTGCLGSSGAISKRSSVPKPSDRPKRLHNRQHDSHRPHRQHQHSHAHNQERPPSSSSSSDEATSSDSSSSDSSSSSGSSSSSSESSSDLEDIVHLRP